MPQQRFGCGHIFIRLDPRGSGDFPAPLGDAHFYALHQLRFKFLDDAVDGRLRLREAEFGVFVHDIEHRAEGCERRGDGFVPAPHPVHVNVRVTGKDQLVFFRSRSERSEDFFRACARGLGQRAGFIHLIGEIVERRVYFTVKTVILRT